MKQPSVPRARGRETSALMRQAGNDKSARDWCVSTAAVGGATELALGWEGM